jgi:hypothetical protein
MSIYYFCSISNCIKTTTKSCPCNKSYYCSVAHQQKDWPAHKGFHAEHIKPKSDAESQVDHTVETKIYADMYSQCKNNASLEHIKETFNRGQRLFVDIKKSTDHLQRVIDDETKEPTISAEPEEQAFIEKTFNLAKEKLLHKEKLIDSVQAKQAILLLRIQAFAPKEGKKKALIFWDQGLERKIWRLPTLPASCG